MSQEDRLFGELRSLFQRQPSQRAWYRLAQLASAWPIESWSDRGAPYILGHLAHAPWELMERPCPRAWAEALARGEQVHPAIELVTSLSMDRGSGYGVPAPVWRAALCARPLPALDQLILTQREAREGGGVPEAFEDKVLNQPTTLVMEEVALSEALWSLSMCRPGAPIFRRLIVRRGSHVAQLAGMMARFGLRWPEGLRALEVRRAGAPMEALHQLLSIPEVRALDELGLSPQSASGAGEAWEQPGALAQALMPEGGGPLIT